MKVTIQIRTEDRESLRELARRLGYTDSLRGAGMPEAQRPGSISGLMRALAKAAREKPDETARALAALEEEGG